MSIDEQFLDALRQIVREEVRRVLEPETYPRATPPGYTTPEFYYIPEVAAKLRRSEPAVRWLIQTGALSATKIGGRVVVTKEQLDAFFNNGRLVEDES